MITGILERAVRGEVVRGEGRFEKAAVGGEGRIGERRIGKRRKRRIS
jgi:hypothetical protein